MDTDRQKKIDLERHKERERLIHKEKRETYRVPNGKDSQKQIN